MWLKALALCCLLATAASAQEADSSLLSLDRIFNSEEFTPAAARPGPLAGQRGSIRQAGGGQRHLRGPRPGPLRRRHRQAGRLGAGEPAGTAGGFGSARGGGLQRVAQRQALLVFTNSKKVWRENTRGDFWVLDLAGGPLRQLGGRGAKPSTLMFAKFAPDGRRVAGAVETPRLDGGLRELHGLRLQRGPLGPPRARAAPRRRPRGPPARRRFHVGSGRGTSSGPVPISAAPLQSLTLAARLYDAPW